MKLVLDFDGVLFDTAYEAYVVAIATYERMNDVKLTIPYEDFLECRPIVGPAWNYKYVLDCLINDNTNDLIDRIADATHEDYGMFETCFFKTRELIKGSDFVEWLKLNKPFDFIEVLCSMDLDWSNVYIVSTKDKKTIVDIVAEYPLLKIDSKNIYGSYSFDKYASKGEVIINEITACSEGVVFIDDMAEHLDSYLDDEKVIKLLPSWGYISQLERKRAKNLDEVLEILNSSIL